jgi:uncharacterized membrane protein YphA (DoxX/SURF4 family)
MKYAATITRLLLGALFVAASWDKLLHPAEFASIIRDYRLLPEPVVPALAVLLPWIELVVGGLLLVGYLPLGALFLANSMLAVFWTALVVTALRGIDIDCGCFSVSAESQWSMGWYILRDGMFVLLGASALTTFLIRQRSGN